MMASSEAINVVETPLLQQQQKPCSLLSFQRKLEARVAAVNSLLCIGLDPHHQDLFPTTGTTTNAINDSEEEERADAAFTFCKTLIDATQSYAACYKPNAAFFEALGSNVGMATLARVIRAIPSDIPVLLDAKRGDIGSTAEAYAKAAYDHARADAVTLSPLMGWDSVQPFVSGKYADRGAFLLCKPSNPGSGDLLALSLPSGETVYERIARLVGHEWGSSTSTTTSQGTSSSSSSTTALLGLVVGATDPAALRQARAAAGQDAWILAPGIGAQGGDLIQAAKAGLNDRGTCLLLPVSRGISQAPDPAAAAKSLWEQIQSVRQQVVAAAGGVGAQEQTKASEEKMIGDSVIADVDVVESSSSSMIQPYQKEFLEFSLSQGVLKFGSFVLKSGRTSPYFFNAGLFSTGAALFKLGEAYASTIMASSSLMEEVDCKTTVRFDVIFGPAYKGISLGAVVACALYRDFGVDVGFAYNRKEAKDHGEGGTLVGAAMEGKRVLIVDDVITAGTAIRESHVLLQSIGAQPVGVVIALDRAEIRSLEDRVSAVQGVARDLSLPVVSIVSLPHLQTFIESSPDYSDETLNSVIAYRNEFGV